MAKVNEFTQHLLYQPKIPQTQDRYVGIEVECFGKNYFRDALKREIIKADLHTSCNVGNDGSIEEIHPHEKGCLQALYQNQDCTCVSIYKTNFSAELRILSTEADLETTLDKIGAILKKLKATTNKTCGLHVHLDMRNRNWTECAARLLRKAPAIWRTVAKERRKSDYCEPITSISQVGHHYCFDFSQVGRLNTIEVRMHEGTTDMKEVLAFSRMLIDIVDNKEETKETFTYRKMRAKTLGHPWVEKKKLKDLVKKKALMKAKIASSR